MGHHYQLYLTSYKNQCLGIDLHFCFRAETDDEKINETVFEMIFGTHSFAVKMQQGIK